MKFIHLPLIIILAVYSSSNSADAYAGFKYEIPYKDLTKQTQELKWVISLQKVIG